MFRILSKAKQTPLGRWKTDKPITVSMRLADLANYDSCGTCGIPNYNSPPEKYISVADDVIDIGYTHVLPGVYEIHSKTKK